MATISISTATVQPPVPTFIAGNSLLVSTTPKQIIATVFVTQPPAPTFIAGNSLLVSTTPKISYIAAFNPAAAAVTPSIFSWS